MRAEDIQIRKALAYATGTADRNGATLDMSPYDWVVAVVIFAAIAATGVNSIKMQQGAASDLSDAADLLGTGITVAADDDDQVFAIALIKPRERYVRVVIDKDAANACAESAIYICGHGKTPPTLANITDELTHEVHVSPAEGTA
jgi:hypothetical protein